MMHNISQNALQKCSDFATISNILFLTIYLIINIDTILSRWLQSNLLRNFSSTYKQETPDPIG